MSQLTVFKIVGSESFDFCHPAPGHTFEELNQFLDGTRKLPAWTPFPVQMVRADEDGRALLAADAPWYGSAGLVLRPPAVLSLGNYLLQYGELLSLSCSDANVVMYNVLRVIDALNEKASEITRFDDGRIISIDRYAFHPIAVRGIDVFKLPQTSRIYVGQGFVDRWNAAGLKGLHFKPIWSTQ